MFQSLIAEVKTIKSTDIRLSSEKENKNSNTAWDIEPIQIETTKLLVDSIRSLLCSVKEHFTARYSHALPGLNSPLFYIY